MWAKASRSARRGRSRHTGPDADLLNASPRTILIGRIASLRVLDGAEVSFRERTEAATLLRDAPVRGVVLALLDMLVW